MDVCNKPYLQIDRTKISPEDAEVIIKAYASGALEIISRRVQPFINEGSLVKFQGQYPDTPAKV